MDNVFFNGWNGALRTFMIGVLAYVMLIFFLRLSGKRTLSKMNAFDFVVTVALGSTLATILLSRDVSLLQGGVALALLIGLQFAVTWSSVRMPWVRKMVTGEPSLLLLHGELLPDSMRRCRITDDDVRSAIRAAGLAGFSAAEAVVLETDASFSVMARSEVGDSGDELASLSNVRRPSGQTQTTH